MDKPSVISLLVGTSKMQPPLALLSRQPPGLSV